MTSIPSLGQHVMTDVAYGPLGPRPALAVSEDLVRWRRLGPAHFDYAPELDTDLNLFPSKLPEDSANSQGLELLNWSFSSVRRCRWGSCLRDLLFVVRARALSPRSWRQSGSATPIESHCARRHGPWQSAAQRLRELDHRDDSANHRKHAGNRRCTRAQAGYLALVVAALAERC